ncbi:Sdccag8 [Phodopus roborovskii]|uniref:Sdccag8 protein n=1 Tax=Phodopus roborovskii TaxID=109678 RepID=A0AAU9ZA22_PHORO|nr:Sdccag8 [Phodopus roborovskii]
MAKSPGNSTLEDSLGQYQRSLRERANRSIHQLKCALRDVDVTVEENALDPSASINVENEDTGVAWHELQHSHAVNQLKALLRQQASKDNEMSPPRRRKMSPLQPSECEDNSMPTVYNLVPIINDQSQYIHHLEAEVKFCKDELSGMKNRVQVVVLENERLQQELKSQRQEETLKEQTLLDASGNIQDSWIKTGESSRVDEATKRPFSHGDAETGKTTSTGDAEKWKLELERLKVTYEAKSDLLESQLMLLRKDLVEYQKTCEDLKERLKHKESLLAAGASSRVGGLCLKCAQHEAVLSQTHSNVHVQAIETLTKERDDLMSALVSVRSSLAEVQQRETSAYKQVKHAVQMTEEANFEKTKALIQCEQLRSELERQTERLEKELAAQQEKRALEKEMIKKEVTKEREDAESKEIEKLRLELSESKQHVEQEQQKAARARQECLQVTELLGESERQLHLTRSEIVRLSQEKRYMCDKLEKIQKRNDELQEQCIQHGRVHETMKESKKEGRATEPQDSAPPCALSHFLQPQQPCCAGGGTVLCHFPSG